MEKAQKDTLRQLRNSRMSKFSDVSAIILAGGKGARTELNTPKQYIRIGEKRVVEYSLENLIGKVGEVVLVMDSPAEWENLEIDLPVKIAQGGPTRTDSLQSGLKEVTNKLVLIHDASRPIIPEGVVNDIVEALKFYKCAYPVLTVKNTVVIDENGFLTGTPDRSKLAKVQTPQGFDIDVLTEALEKSSDEHAHIPELVRRLGYRVKHVKGSPWLFKITYESDILAAHHFIKKYIERKDVE